MPKKNTNKMNKLLDDRMALNAVTRFVEDFCEDNKNKYLEVLDEILEKIDSEIDKEN